jgi:hypothetical protein
MGYVLGSLSIKTGSPKPPFSLLFHPCLTSILATAFDAYANIQGISVRKKKATLDVLGMC